MLKSGITLAKMIPQPLLPTKHALSNDKGVVQIESKSTKKLLKLFNKNLLMLT